MSIASAGNKAKNEVVSWDSVYGFRLHYCDFYRK